MSARMRTLFSSTVIIAVTALACGREGSVPARRMRADRLDILPTALADSCLTVNGVPVPVLFSKVPLLLMALVPPSFWMLPFWKS